MVIQTAIETSQDPIPYSGYIKTVISIVAGTLLILTGPKKQV